MPKRSKAEMLEDLRQKLAAAEVEAKQADAKKARALADKVNALQQKSADLATAKSEAIAKVEATYDARIAKVEERLADAEAELAELATGDAEQMSFTSVKLDEVSNDTDVDA